MNFKQVPSSSSTEKGSGTCCCCCCCCCVASVVSDSLRPYRRQPTRLPFPWDPPGKNTGVGCHFLLQCMKVKVKSLSRVRLLATSWTAAYQAPPSMGFSRQEYWSGVPLPSPQVPAISHQIKTENLNQYRRSQDQEKLTQICPKLPRKWMGKMGLCWYNGSSFS